MYDLLTADRSDWNESKAKDVYGCIAERGSDVVVCYVPNKRQAAVVLNALCMARLAELRSGFHPAPVGVANRGRTEVE